MSLWVILSRRLSAASCRQFLPTVLVAVASGKSRGLSAFLASLATQSRGVLGVWAEVSTKTINRFGVMGYK